MLGLWFRRRAGEVTLKQGEFRMTREKRAANCLRFIEIRLCNMGDGP